MQLTRSILRELLCHAGRHVSRDKKLVQILADDIALAEDSEEITKVENLWAKRRTKTNAVRHSLKGLSADFVIQKDKEVTNEETIISFDWSYGNVLQFADLLQKDATDTQATCETVTS